MKIHIGLRHNLSNRIDKYASHLRMNLNLAQIISNKI